jgi:hypothetical protein
MALIERQRRSAANMIGQRAVAANPGDTHRSQRGALVIFVVVVDDDDKIGRDEKGVDSSG